MPGADSPQTMVVQKAAEDQLGDPNALRTRLVFMSHPDAMQALLSGRIGAHMPSAPFTYEEKRAGARRLLGSDDVFDDPINNTVTAVSDKATKNDADTVRALAGCVERARDLLRNHPDQAASYLSRAYCGKESPDSIEADLEHEDLRWPSAARGMASLAEFMTHPRLIDTPPSDPADMVYAPNAER